MSTSASPASFSSIDESRPRLNNFRRLLSALHSTAHFYAKLLGLEATGYSQLEAGTIVPEPEFPGLHEDLGKVFKQISTLYIHEEIAPDELELATIIYNCCDLLERLVENGYLCPVDPTSTELLAAAPDSVKQFRRYGKYLRRHHASRQESEKAVQLLLKSERSCVAIFDHPHPFMLSLAEANMTDYQEDASEYLASRSFFPFASHLGVDALRTACPSTDDTQAINLADELRPVYLNFRHIIKRIERLEGMQKIHQGEADLSKAYFTLYSHTLAHEIAHEHALAAGVAKEHPQMASALPWYCKPAPKFVPKSSDMPHDSGFVIYIQGIASSLGFTQPRAPRPAIRQLPREHLPKRKLDGDHGNNVTQQGEGEGEGEGENEQCNSKRARTIVE